MAVSEVEVRDAKLSVVPYIQSRIFLDLEEKAAIEKYIVYDDVDFAPPQEILCWGVDYYKPAFTDFRNEEFHTGYDAYFRRGVLPEGVDEVGFVIDIINSVLTFTRPRTTGLGAHDVELLARLLVCESGNKLSSKDYQ
jgi:hypothetical protein